VSRAMLAWSAAGALVAALACVRLLRASNQPEPSVKNGYRWLAVAAVCLAVGAIVHQAFGGLIGGALPLRLADLISLGALPAAVIGLATLTSDLPGRVRAAPRGGRLMREHGGMVPAAATPGMAVDSCLLVGALFVIFLATLFGPDYLQAHVGRAAFALALIRPFADLVALGLVLRFVVRSIRLTLSAVLALVALAVSDALAVADRTAGHVAGPGTQAALIVALLLLAAAPATTSALAKLARRPALVRFVRSDNSWSSPATIAALVATAVAALLVTGLAAVGHPLWIRPLALVGSVVVLLLVARLAGLTRQASAVAEAAQESDWMFRALAATTSDAVLICDLVGTIEYASQAVTEFGYAPAELTGKRLADIVHPEDRSAGIRAAITGLRAAAGTARFAGRIRGADGSWRYVESTISRYGAAGEPARLLITSRDVSDRVALSRQLTQLTFHDGLTGLPNRAYVEDRVKDLTRESAGADRPGGQETDQDQDPQLLAGAILVDFDGYTAVNGLVGHAGGDLVLAQAARRLRAAVAPSATVARWGGDEFAVLVGSDATAQEVIDLAERLAGLIAAEPFSVAAKEIALTVSVGAAVTAVGHADQILGNAGIALAKAQEAGVGRVEIFAAAMHAEAHRRLELAEDLRRAAAEHRLEVDYEPIVELATGNLRGVEAVVRWSRNGEIVPLAEFLAVAEESGLIAGVGEWALRQACRQVAAWRADGLEIGLSVSCTARQACGPGFVRTVIAALDEAELPPEQLTIEVTERVLSDGPPPAAADLAGLRGKGIRLALDSFGTGHTSLALLRRSAVDVIKIDSSFVTGLGTDPTLALLTKSIIGLALDLGIEVIAEGIERPEQRARLEEMGCALGQGPGLAGPLPARELEPALAGLAENRAENRAEDHAGDTACTTVC
jgi:diguanylate cyclase (GGDEF)-like protein/PAS domain S-box-containing protein